VRLPSAGTRAGFGGAGLKRADDRHSGRGLDWEYRPPRARKSSGTTGASICAKDATRVGVALYGLNLSLQQILQVGPAAIAADLFVVTSTISVGWWVGFRWFKMDRDTVLLASAGSGICGAAAVVATESVLGAAGPRAS
jgi:uncharacterized membrane protein YadS